MENVEDIRVGLMNTQRRIDRHHQLLIDAILADAHLNHLHDDTHTANIRERAEHLRLETHEKNLVIMALAEALSKRASPQQWQPLHHYFQQCNSTETPLNAATVQQIVDHMTQEKSNISDSSDSVISNHSAKITSPNTTNILSNVSIVSTESPRGQKHQEHMSSSVAPVVSNKVSPAASANGQEEISSTVAEPGSSHSSSSSLLSLDKFLGSVREKPGDHGPSTKEVGNQTRDSWDTHELVYTTTGTSTATTTPLTATSVDQACKSASQLDDEESNSCGHLDAHPGHYERSRSSRISKTIEKLRNALDNNVRTERMKTRVDCSKKLHADLNEVAQKMHNYSTELMELLREIQTDIHEPEAKSQTKYPVMVADLMEQVAYDAQQAARLTRALLTNPTPTTAPAPKTSISRTPASRASLSRAPASKTSISRVPASKTSISRVPASKTSISSAPVSKTSFSRAPASKTSTLQAAASKSSITRAPAAKKLSEASTLSSTPPSKSSATCVPTPHSAPKPSVSSATSNTSVELAPLPAHEKPSKPSVSSTSCILSPASVPTHSGSCSREADKSRPGEGSSEGVGRYGDMLDELITHMHASWKDMDAVKRTLHALMIDLENAIKGQTDSLDVVEEVEDEGQKWSATSEQTAGEGQLCHDDMSQVMKQAQQQLDAKSNEVKLARQELESLNIELSAEATESSSEDGQREPPGGGASSTQTCESTHSSLHDLNPPSLFLCDQERGRDKQAPKDAPLNPPLDSATDSRRSLRMSAQELRTGEVVISWSPLPEHPTQHVVAYQVRVDGRTYHRVRNPSRTSALIPEVTGARRISVVAEMSSGVKVLLGELPVPSPRRPLITIDVSTLQTPPD